MAKHVSTVLDESLDWEYGDHMWVLRFDLEGAAQWMAPREDGTIGTPKPEEVPKWLASVIEPDQLEDLQAAIADNTWPAIDRYKAAAGWYSMASGREDLINRHAIRAEILTEANEKLRADVAEKIAEALAKTDEQLAAKSEDPQAPLDDA